MQVVKENTFFGIMLLLVGLVTCELFQTLQALLEYLQNSLLKLFLGVYFLTLVNSILYMSP